MRAKTLVLPLLLALGMTGCASTSSPNMLAADAAHALPANGPVAVNWHNPAEFSEFKTSSNRFAAAQGDWLQELAKYMRKRAALRLDDGNTLELTIVDLQRAGRYEPWLGPSMQDARIIRDIYPPRMTVHFRELDANGQVLAEGERKISDPAFLTHSAPLNNTDPLRYEKRMVDSWLQREFSDSTAAR